MSIQLIFMVLIAGLISTGVMNQFREQAFNRKADVVAAELRSLSLGLANYYDQFSNTPNFIRDADLEKLHKCSSGEDGSAMCQYFFMRPVDKNVYSILDKVGGTSVPLVSATANLENYNDANRLARMVSVRLGGKNIAEIDVTGKKVAINIMSAGFFSEVRPWLARSGSSYMEGSLKFDKTKGNRLDVRGPDGKLLSQHEGSTEVSADEVKTGTVRVGTFVYDPSLNP